MALVERLKGDSSYVVYVQLAVCHMALEMAINVVFFPVHSFFEYFFPLSGIDKNDGMVVDTSMS